MDEARKKLRVCLICVVAAAVILGLLYCFLDVQGETAVSEGTLVSVEMPDEQAGIAGPGSSGTQER